MPTKTYRGSCQCKRITFEADVDLTAGSHKCNCTGCWKRRLWSLGVKPPAFRPLTGAEFLSTNRPGEPRGSGGFCTHCGVITYTHVDAADWNDGAYVSIAVSSLDDLDPADLVAAPIRLLDGRNDDWFHVPAETRHL